MIYCERHKTDEAEYHCSRCEQGFCRECAVKRKFGDGHIHVCPVCDNSLTYLAPYRKVRPFWTELPFLLKFPFGDVGLVLMIAWPLFGLFVRGAPVVISESGVAVWYVNAIFYVIYFLVPLPLFYHVVVSAVDGDFGFPAVNLKGVVEDSFFVPFTRILAPLVGLGWPVVFLLYLAWSAFLRNPDVSGNFELVFILVLVCFYFAFVVFAFPMALLVTAVFRNAAAVFNIVNIVRQIRLIAKEYSIYMALVYLAIGLYILWVWAYSAVVGIKGILGYSVFYLADSWIHIYIALVAAQTLGYLAYQTRFKLKWWPETREEPSFMVDGDLRDMGVEPKGYRAAMAASSAGVGSARAAAAKLERNEPGRPRVSERKKPMGAPPGDDGADSGKGQGAPAPPLLADLERDPAEAPGGSEAPDIAGADGAGEDAGPETEEGRDERLQQMIERGLYLNDHGTYDQAAAIFRAVLDENPDSFSAMHGLLLASFKLEDFDTIREYGPRMGSEMSRTHSFEALHGMYQDYKRRVPDFSFRPEDLVKLGAWLIENDKPLGGARVLREFAVTNPHHEKAPESLLACALALRDRCDKASNAANVFRGIVTRYPGSPEAGRAQEELERGDEPA